MTHPRPNITVNVDVTNPGQFFACCGLLELADRLWPGAQGWFERATFHVESDRTFDQLLRAITEADLIQVEPENDAASPIHSPTQLIFDRNE